MLIRYFVSFAVLSWLALALPVAAVTEPANDPLVIHDCSFGDVYQFAKAGCTVKIENSGPTPLQLAIVPVQDGNSVEPATLAIQPHASATLRTRVQTDNIAGEVTWTFRIEGAGTQPHFANASGFVASVLDDPRPAIAFDSIDLARAPMTKSIALTSSPYPGFRITKILSAADFLHARIGGDGRELVTAIGRDAPWGPIEEWVKVAIDTPVQNELWIQVTGDVQGEIGPAKNPFWLGAIPWGQRAGLSVPLIDRNGHEFRIASVTAKELKATYDNASCDPPADGCRKLIVHISDAQPPGLFKAQLDVAFGDRANHLHVGIWGILGDRPIEGQQDQTPLTPKPLPMARRPANDGSPPPLKTQADPSGEGPLLKWTIAQQASVHGYQVFRSDAETGPFTLMAPNLINVVDNGSGPVAYRWRDTTAVKGNTYWYYIAVVYKTGERKALSGPAKTVAK